MGNVTKDLKLDDLIVRSGSTIKEAIQTIDNNMCGMCFVVEHGYLKGVVSDGDVRRSMLNNTKLDQDIDQIMNKEFFSLPAFSEIKTIQEGLLKYNLIPILDEKGMLVDYASTKHFHQIPIHEPYLNGNELEYISECITTGWVSSQGKYVKKFEEDFSKYVGIDNALAVSNGTVALHLALETFGIGKGDEVIVPNLTFAAPINAIIHSGAKPVIVDVCAQTACLDVHHLEQAISSCTKAIIAVHLYGHPVEMEALVEISRKHNIKIIEDCAEAIGSRYNDRHVGCFGDAATFSFFGNKTITTGEGGMVFFKEITFCQRAKILRDHGMSPTKRYWHEEIGYNYRMTNLQAAVGVAQLEQIEYIIQRKRWMANEYFIRLNELDHIQLPIECGNVFHSYWLYTIFLREENEEKKNEIINKFKRIGVEVRTIFYPLNEMPIYKRFEFKNCDYGVSKKLFRCGLSLPSSISVSAEEIDKIADTMHSTFS